MQDKEFDAIFNSKFEDFEAEPSPMVWNNIDAQLGGKKSKGTIMTWLSIAATIIVLCTAGILLLQKDKVVDKTHPNKLAINRVKQQVPVKKDVPVKKEEQVIIATKPVNQIALNKIHKLKNILPANKVVVPVTQPVVNTSVQTQIVNADDKKLIAVVPDPASTQVKATVPDNIALVPKSADVIAHTPAERPAIMASTENQEATPVKKHGIHSFGGLINVLVAKIDKRPDKIIEFTDSEDDDAESNITGVNLGLVKIKKQ